MVQWLRLLAAPTVGMGSIPDRGTKIHACYVALPKEKKKIKH